MLKKYFILLFIGPILIPGLVYGQEINRRYLDSLIPTLTSNKNDAVVINKADSVCYAIRKMSPKAADDIYDYFDKNISDDRVKMVIYDRWGPTLAGLGQVEKSHAIRHKALRLAKKRKDLDYIIDINNSLSRYFISIALADSASYYIHRVETLALQDLDAYGWMFWDVNYVKGEVQKLLGNREKQGYYYEKAWEVMDTSSVKSAQNGFFLYILTEHFKIVKDYKKQSYYGNLLIEYHAKKGLTTPNYHFPIESLFLNNDSSEELQDLIQVIEVSKKEKILGTYAASVGILADIYMEDGAAKQAIPYLEDLIKILDSAKFPYNHSRDREMLQRAYAADGNYKMAYTKLLEYKSMSDSIRNQEALSKIVDYEVKYETEKKEGQIKLLSVENEKNKRLQELYSILAILGAFTLALFGFFLLKIRKKNRLLDMQKTLLEATVDEKNVLLKETHHRVKNSFQIVSSLLYLQSESIQDKEAQIAIKEAQNRVRSMVLIHQKLYSKDQLVGINTTEYFTDLTKDIFESHQFEGNKIQYELDIDSMVLDIETITPIGLILNEMITNVIKHAFDEVSENSKMDVIFQRKGEELVLQVMDNGKGMPSEIKESSFGIQLIKALAKKLKANLSFPKSHQGTLASLQISRFSEL